jgi:hypothetical protein
MLGRAAEFVLGEKTMKMAKSQMRMMQCYIARTSASTSATRGGRKAVKGVKKAARDYLSQPRVLDAVSRAKNYPQVLNKLTKELTRAFPAKARFWGRARKLVNIFIRDATYNAHLREAFGLARIEPLLEIPIDTIVAKRLKSEFPHLPRWRAISSLSPDENRAYQSAAGEAAVKRHIERHLLDVEYWGDSDR